MHNEAKPIFYFGYLGGRKVLYIGHVGGPEMALESGGVISKCKVRKSSLPLISGVV